MLSQVKIRFLFLLLFPFLSACYPYDSNPVFYNQGHSCALLDSGAVRCWGENNEAQLGYGHLNAIGDNEIPESAGDVDMGIGLEAYQIATGYAHTCVLLTNDAVRCWGDNSSGQLGYGHTNRIGDNETPADVGDVDLGLSMGVKVTQIAAGGRHTCALLDSGAVRCWGTNFRGQLGYGHTGTIGDDETPAKAASAGKGGDVDVGTSLVTQITAGDAHTCVLLSDGAVRCWGTNSSGQLGYGHTGTIGDDETPAWAASTGRGGDIDLGLSMGVKVTQIAAGYAHTCVLLSDDAVRCWGGNISGQLGYGHTGTIGDDETPANAFRGGDVDLGLSAGVKVTQIAAGGHHTCVLLSDSAVRCWGGNISGQLGYGHTNDLGDDEMPTGAGDVDLGLSTGVKVTQITASDSHTCVLLDDKTVRCWGANGRGQLGYGHTNSIGDDETPASARAVNLGEGLTVQDLWR